MLAARSKLQLDCCLYCSVDDTLGHDAAYVLDLHGFSELPDCQADRTSPDLGHKLVQEFPVVK